MKKTLTLIAAAGLLAGCASDQSGQGAGGYDQGSTTGMESSDPSIPSDPGWNSRTGSSGTLGPGMDDTGRGTDAGTSDLDSDFDTVEPGAGTNGSDTNHTGTGTR